MSDRPFTIRIEGNVAFFEGVLNEFADLDPLKTITGHLIMDLAGLCRTNSMGLRLMLKVIVGWANRSFTYRNCPPEFIEQINMIPAMLGQKRTGKVESILAPYYCEEDDEEVYLPRDIKVFADFINGGPCPPEPCPQCGGDMEIESRDFFLFETYYRSAG